jgi:hypothetical protein
MEAEYGGAYSVILQSPVAASIRLINHILGTMRSLGGSIPAQLTAETHMEASDTNWLRERMREFVANSSEVVSGDNILNFRRETSTAKSPGAAALDLVYQAAEVIGDVEKVAAEREAHAESLASQAVEKLKIADERVRSAESARRAAEAEITEFKEKVEREFNVKLQEIENAMEQAASRLAATQAQLTAAEEQANAAESRATEAENALKRIEAAIQTQILSKRIVDLSKRSVRAA